jgi:hypothetical protein
MAKASRQRTYQQNNIAKGLCAICPRPAFKWKRCRKHYKRALEDYKKQRAKVAAVKAQPIQHENRPAI